MGAGDGRCSFRQCGSGESTVSYGSALSEVVGITYLVGVMKVLQDFKGLFWEESGRRDGAGS